MGSGSYNIGLVGFLKLLFSLVNCFFLNPLIIDFVRRASFVILYTVTRHGIGVRGLYSEPELILSNKSLW